MTHKVGLSTANQQKSNIWSFGEKQSIYKKLFSKDVYLMKIICATWNCHTKLIFQLIKWPTYNLQTSFAQKMTCFLRFLSNNWFNIYVLVLKRSNWYFLFSWHTSSSNFLEKQGSLSDTKDPWLRSLIIKRTCFPVRSL